jgi:hypothetical protein
MKSRNSSGVIWLSFPTNSWNHAFGAWWCRARVFTHGDISMTDATVGRNLRCALCRPFFRRAVFRSPRLPGMDAAGNVIGESDDVHDCIPCRMTSTATAIAFASAPAAVDEVLSTQ